MANLSYGLSDKINGVNLIHYYSTKKGSSDAPFLLIDSFKVIGIHLGTSKKKNFFFSILEIW